MKTEFIYHMGMPSCVKSWVRVCSQHIFISRLGNTALVVCFLHFCCLQNYYLSSKYNHRILFSRHHSKIFCWFCFCYNVHKICCEKYEIKGVALILGDIYCPFTGAKEHHLKEDVTNHKMPKYYTKHGIKLTIAIHQYQMMSYLSKMI